MNILILEDEIPAYNRITKYLDSYFKNKVKHDWSSSNTEGKKLLLRNSYDLILSDIKLLDGISFDLFEELEIKTPIIFCSAHDDYLLKAFKTNGIEYILKPYSKKDFEIALDKYQNLFKNESTPLSIDTNILKELKLSLISEVKPFKKRFAIKSNQGIQLVYTKDIGLIQASGDFCVATDINENHHYISNSLSSILEQLDPAIFFKINRSEIINLNFINSIKSYKKNRLIIDLKHIDKTVTTSASTTPSFRKWIED